MILREPPGLARWGCRATPFWRHFGPEHPIHEKPMIASPCTNLCRMDGMGKFCLGCWRTLDEIVAWGAMSDAQRQSVLVGVAYRRSASLQDEAGIE